MTRAKARSVIGISVEREVTPLGVWSLFVELGDGKRIWGHGPNEKTAAQRLVIENYKRICDIVDRLQEYRCRRCGQRQPLSHHHKTFRSHGRKDTVENIEALCLSCHNAAHHLK
jgi:hypothetical protein